MTQVHSEEKENPKAWWSEIKRLGGMKSMNSSLINLINIAGLEDISEHELANRINTASLSPYQNINYLHRQDDLAWKKGFCHSYKNSTLVKVVALTKCQIGCCVSML